MRFPDSFTVLGQRVAVTSHRKIKLKDERCLGVTDNDRQRVTISRDQSDDKIRETFLHEMLHIVNGLAGARLDFTKAQEETLVKRTAPILLDALRSNPDVVKFLTRGKQ
jgi:hypothetical protein